jgi:phosphatidylserine synthase 2
MYCAVVFYCFFILAVDCDSFFLKYMYWIPAEHWLVQFRIAIWAFSAIPATKEFYEYVTNKYCYRIGPFIWMLTFTLFVELSIMFKYGSTIFVEDFPFHVKVIWTILITVFLAGGVYAYSNQKKSEKK